MRLFCERGNRCPTCWTYYGVWAALVAYYGALTGITAWAVGKLTP